MDLALNNLQRLICHKTKPNQTIIWFGLRNATLVVCLGQLHTDGAHPSPGLQPV